MKVLHINYVDAGGGAAIAARRHCEAMISAGVDAKLLVFKKKKTCPYIISFDVGKIRYVINRVIEKILFFIEKRLDPVATFSLMYNGFDLHKCSFVKDADVIFLHWVNGGTLSIKDVELILSLSKPTYLYMHDMNSITGGCHHSFGCLNFEDNCDNCPILCKNSSWCKSIAKKQLMDKYNKWGKYDNLIFVAPSIWLSDLISKSLIAQGHQVLTIPNVINTLIFRPLKKEKEKWGLDPRKKTILFGNASLSSPYKGSQYAIDCLKKLDPNEFEGLVIGNDDNSLFSSLPIKTVYTGYINEEEDIVRAYNASDTMIITSVAENYPNVVMEAMACGIPCVGFKVGGIPDLIRNNFTGILSSEISSIALYNSILRLFSDEELYKQLSANSRKLIEDNNSYINTKQIHYELFA